MTIRTGQCEIQHLEATGIFLLNYKSSLHPSAHSFLDIKGIDLAEEDQMTVGIGDGDGSEERPYW